MAINHFNCQNSFNEGNLYFPLEMNMIYEHSITFYVLAYHNLYNSYSKVAQTPDRSFLVYFSSLLGGWVDGRFGDWGCWKYYHISFHLCCSWSFCCGCEMKKSYLIFIYVATRSKFYWIFSDFFSLCILRWLSQLFEIVNQGLHDMDLFRKIPRLHLLK